MASPNYEIKQIQANGLQFGYISNGDGPLILCMHGFPDVATTFHYQLEAFAAAGYRVVAPFCRGYAPTDAPESASYQSAAFGQDVLALIDALGYEKAILLGHDWGVTSVTAAAVIEPEKVSKLITCAVPYGSGFGQALFADYAQQKRSWYMFFFQLPLADMAVPFNNFQFIEQLWRDWSPTWDFPEERLREVQETLAKPGVLAAALAYYRFALNPQLAHPALEELQAKIGQPINIPTLHIHGEVDGCIGSGLTQGMEAFFSNGLQTEIVNGAGHFVHQENPERFNELVLEFLEN